MTILETQISGKGDDTVYAAFEDINSIKEIHARMAEIQNKKLSARNFIPPNTTESTCF